MCSFDLQEVQASSLNILTVVDHDVSDVVDVDQGDVAIEVNGFPGFQQPGQSGSVRPCNVLVSTAQGEFLEVDLFYGKVTGDLPVERACELTTRAATFAVQTLLAQR
jgi:hypothetical protein